MSHGYWYATRGTGVAALILLTLVVCLGVTGSLRLRSDRWPRFLVVGLHRNLTLLALAFLAGHIATTVLDSFTPVGLRDAVVPFLGRYRPFWLGLGAVAFDLLLALTLTSLLRARIGYRTWRSLHWLAYAAWPIALAHGLGTGSDARFGWMQAVAASCVAAVLAATVSRVASSAAAPRRRIVAGAAALACAFGGVAWYRGGPGAPGWAARAGTPARLLRHAVPATAAPRRTIADLPLVPFTAELNGRISTVVERSGLVRLDIRGRTSGGARGVLWIRLQGRPVGDGGVTMTASGVRFGTAVDPNLYTGTIRALQGTQLAIALRDGAGKRIDLAVALNVDQASNSVTGTLRAASAGDSQ